MSKLLQDVQELGGKIYEIAFNFSDEIQSLSEDVIFDCLGLGAREVFADLELKPVKGQLLLHAAIDLDFVLGHDEYCLVPRGDALVFGSLWQEDFDTPEPNLENEELIWDEVNRLFGDKGSTVEVPKQHIKRELIFDSVAALRPFRQGGVRLVHWGGSK